MHSSKPDDEPGPACACGRSLQEAAASVYRSQASVFLFHRCPCGREWTERRDGFDPAEPISGDEVIEVHRVLRRFRGSIAEMLRLHSV